MKNIFEYTIFKTNLGYFAIVAKDENLIQTFLPGLEKQNLKTKILNLYPDAKQNTTLLKNLQQQIKDYFEGQKANFNINITPAIKNLSTFTQTILKACHKIPPSKTISYNQLATLANHPNAARATGTALSKNPIPPIIPCHRIIKSTGQPGNFTAPTGKSLKQKLLNLEAQK